MLGEFTLEDLLDESKHHKSESISTTVGDTLGIKLYRDCLAAAISGGNAKNLLVHSLTYDELSRMTPDENSTPTLQRE